MRTVKFEKYNKSMEKVRVEKVIIVNAPAAWKDKDEVVVMEEGAKESKRRKNIGMTYHPKEGKKAAYAVIRDPHVGIGRGWKIDFGGASSHNHHGHEH